MKVYKCDRCGKNIPANEIYHLGLIKGEIDLMGLISSMLVNDEAKVTSSAMNDIIDFIVNTYNPNEPVFCEECAKEIRNFAGTSIERKVANLNQSNTTKIKTATAPTLHKISRDFSTPAGNMKIDFESTDKKRADRMQEILDSFLKEY